MPSTQNKLWREGLDPKVHPHKVLILRDQLIDKTRHNRPVKIKLYYPANYTLGKLPVVFWSHGLGGSVEGASFLSRFLASQGFIIVHVQHLGSDSSLWEGKEGIHGMLFER